MASEAGRVPPSDLDAEGAVLCAALLDSAALDEAEGTLTASDFYADCNRRIWEAIVECRTAGQPADIVTVASLLRDQGRLAQIGGAPYLAQLANATPAIAHVEAHARIVVDKARQRRLIAIAQRYAAEGYCDIGSVEDWAQRFEREVFEATRGATERDPAESLATLVPDALSAIRERQEAGGRAPGADTGWRDLTNKIGGWEDGLVYVIAGRPGMGKSATMLGAALNIAKRGELAVFFSAEMPKDQLTARAVAAEANLDTMRVRSGKLNTDEFNSLCVAANRISRCPLWIDHKAGATAAMIRSSIRRASAKSQKKPRFVAVDYLQILKGKRDKGENREGEVSGLMREMLGIADEFQCPVIVGSQLNRGVENRAVKDKRPTLGDLRESGSIEQDAYGVLMLYRDEYYHEDSPDRGILEVIIAKNRNGGPGRVNLHFTAESTRISNLATEYDEIGDFADDGYAGYP
jgi:replicative DNA helicase